MCIKAFPALLGKCCLDCVIDGNGKRGWRGEGLGGISYLWVSGPDGRNRSGHHPRSRLLSGIVWKEVAITPSERALSLQLLRVACVYASPWSCLSETVYSSFPISWISYVESFFATKRASPASQWFSLKKIIHMFQKTSQLLWLLQINIVLCFRNLMSVFLSSRWVEQQCWVLASGPWWRRATTWVCWLPALLQSRRTPWSWPVAWWWWQASWAAALSSGSRKAVCPWWGGGPCLLFLVSY